MSRRPPDPRTLRVARSGQRMAPGGRRWSESPVPRVGKRRIRAVGATPAANPWPLAVEFADAVAVTSTTIKWEYDAHPEAVYELNWSVSKGTGAGDLRYRIDGGSWSSGYALASPPGGAGDIFTITPTHIVSVEFEWDLSANVDAATWYLTPEWY